jgi:hypothetical protein
MRLAYCALQSCTPQTRTTSSRPKMPGPVSSLVGAAFGRLASSRPRAVSLIGRTRGSAIGGILEAETAKSSRRTRRTFLTTRIETLPAPCFYRAPRIINGASLLGHSEHGRQRQSGNHQFSHAASSPLWRLYAIGAHVGYLACQQEFENRGRSGRESAGGETRITPAIKTWSGADAEHGDHLPLQGGSRPADALRQRAGRGWRPCRRAGMGVVCGTAVTPPRTAFGSPTLSLRGRVPRGNTPRGSQAKPR